MAYQKNPSTICPWCKGTHLCAMCSGTGARVVRTRVLHRRRELDCQACAGTGVCQLCKARQAAAS